MKTADSTLHRWRLTVQYRWLAQALFAWTKRPGHNALMSAGEGVCALLTVCINLGLLWKGITASAGLYSSSAPLSALLVVAGVLLTMGMTWAFFTVAAFLAETSFLTSIDNTTLKRSIEEHTESDHAAAGPYPQLAALLKENPYCDLSPAEWWVVQRVWSQEGERAWRHARLHHVVPEAPMSNSPTVRRL